MARRLLVLVALVGLMTVTLAAPAFAHGGGGSDATNFRSEVDTVVEGDGREPGGTPAELENVSWKVRALDSYLEVSNESGEELVVFGYEGEPYLRIGPNGVLENRNSPAVYLNNDRFAETPVPEGVSRDAEPEWVEVASEPTYRWHDHRIHWMAQTEPPQVKTDRTAVHVIQDWAVPFTLASGEFAVQGQLRWIPPSPSWPWLVAALVISTVAFGVVFFTSSRGATRNRRLIRAGVAIVITILILDVVHAVDDVLAVPASLSENLYALGQSLAFIAIGVFGAVRGWRGGDGAPTALAIGAGSLLFGIGLTHLSSLASSQVASVLPPGFTRAVVALNVAALPPVIAAVAYVVREEVGTEQPDEQPGQDTTGVASEATA